MERREEGLKRGHIPPRGLILVGAADVQKRGIYLEVVAFAETRESWVVDADYIDGDTIHRTAQPMKRCASGWSIIISRTPSAGHGRSTRLESNADLHQRRLCVGALGAAHASAHRAERGFCPQG